jgi:hypothetical protein
MNHFRFLTLVRPETTFKREETVRSPVKETLAKENF